MQDPLCTDGQTNSIIITLFISFLQMWRSKGKAYLLLSHIVSLPNETSNSNGPRFIIGDVNVLMGKRKFTYLLYTHVIHFCYSS